MKELKENRYSLKMNLQLFAKDKKDEDPPADPPQDPPADPPSKNREEVPAWAKQLQNSLNSLTEILKPKEQEGQGAKEIPAPADPPAQEDEDEENNKQDKQGSSFLNWLL